MDYQGTVYRPPSEAQSLIVQVTYGCSHNACTFCDMYRDRAFLVRPVKDVLRDIKNYPSKQNVKRVFLADGNALCLAMPKLEIIFDALNKNFVNLERVGIYATAKDVLSKSVDELKCLRQKNLGIVYIGVESGSDAVLMRVNKNSTAQDVQTATDKLKRAGIKLSAIILSGLGGQSLTREHAIKSAELMNRVQPEYLALLALMNYPNTPLSQQIKKGDFKPLSPRQVVQETKIFIENLKLNKALFRSNHNSNYILLSGELGRDQDAFLRALEAVDLDELQAVDEFRTY